MSAAFTIGDAAEYRAHFDGSDSVPLWQQPWWLDAAAGPGWEAVVLLSGGRVVAALPYTATRRLGVRMWSQPPLTQSLGPWLEPSGAKYVKALSREHELLAALADEIPGNVYYAQNWGTARQNWLPFYWAGYRQTTRYTYRLDLPKGEQTLWDQLSEHARKAIRKARGRNGVTAETSSDLSTFIDLNAHVFQRQQLQAPHPPALLRRIHAAAESRGAVRVVIGRESDGTPSAAAFIVRDADTSYYLMGGAHPELRRSGSQTLVLWEAIRGEIEHSRWFDFEGSMIEPIERSFRSYGAKQTPYLRVEGSRGPWVGRMATAHRLLLAR